MKQFQIKKKLLKSFWFWSFGLVILFYLITGFFNINQIGLTTDEYSHIGASEGNIHGYGLNQEHPQGQKILNSIYFKIFEKDYNPSSPELRYKRYNRGKDVLINSKRGGDDVIFWSRFAYLISNGIIFLVLILLSFGYRWLDPRFSLFLSVLYAFSPTFYPHAVLANFDVGGAVSIFSLVLFLFISLKNVQNWNSKTSSVIFGAGFLTFWALNTKFSNLIILPVLVLWSFGVLVYFFRKKNKRLKQIIWHLVGSLFMIIFLTGLINAIAFGNSKTTQKMAEEFADEELVYTNIYKPIASVLPWLGSSREDMAKNIEPVIIVSKPLWHYNEGALATFSRSGDEQPPFLFGEWTEYTYGEFMLRIIWFKETPFIILGLLLSLFYWFWESFKFVITSKPKLQNPKLYDINKNIISITTYTVLLFFPLIYFVMAFDKGLVIGYRHAYPLVIFLYGLISFTLVRIWDQLKNNTTKLTFKFKNFSYNLISLLGFFLIFGLIFDGILAIPKGISYISPLWQGEKWQLTNESTINWGQDQYKAWEYLLKVEPDLKNPNTKIKVGSYFYHLVPSASEVSKIENNQYIYGVDEYQYFDYRKQLINQQDFDYFVVDARYFQRSQTDITAISQLNFDYIQNLTPVYNYNDIIFVYKLK